MRDTKLTPRGTAAATAFAIYLALSVTQLHPLLPLLVLTAAGLLVAFDTTPPDAKERPWANPSGVLLTGLFVCSIAISTAFSIEPARSLDSLVLLFPGLLFIFLFHHLSPMLIERHYLHRGLSLMAGVAALMVIRAYLASGDEDPLVALRAIDSPALVVPNDLLLCVMAIPFAFYGLTREQSIPGRLVPALAVALCVIAIFMIRSRICLIALLVICSVYIHAYRPRYLLPGILALVVIAISLDVLLDIGVSRKFLETWARNQRLGIWYIGIVSFGDHPFTGIGPAHYLAIYREGVETVSLPHWMQIDAWMVSWAHSLFLEALLERGIVGLATTIVLFGHMLWYFHQRIKLAKGPPDGLDVAAFAGFCAFLVAGTVESTLQRTWVVTTLFIFIALYLVPTRPLASYQQDHTRTIYRLGIKWSRRSLAITGAVLLLVFLTAASSSYDKQKVSRDIAVYCDSLAAGGKDQSPEKLFQRQESCRLAFRDVIREQPVDFFVQAGNSTALASLRTLWWWVDFQSTLRTTLPLLAFLLTVWAVFRLLGQSLRLEDTGTREDDTGS